jgi:hypothetical protein
MVSIGLRAVAATTQSEFQTLTGDTERPPYGGLSIFYLSGSPLS